MKAPELENEEVRARATRACEALINACVGEDGKLDAPAMMLAVAGCLAALCKVSKVPLFAMSTAVVHLVARFSDVEIEKEEV